MPVGDHPADEREQQDRQLAEKVVQPKEKRGFGQVENEPALRHLLHPRADRRGEGAEPQNAKIPVSKRCQRALQERVAEGDRGAAAGLRRGFGLHLQRGGQETLILTVNFFVIYADGRLPLDPVRRRHYTRGKTGEQKAKHMAAARAEIESLLRARKLDVTLTSAAPWIRGRRDAAPTGISRARRGARRRPAARSPVGSCRPTLGRADDRRLRGSSRRPPRAVKLSR